MKKIFLILMASAFTFNISYADNKCRKYNNLLQQKEYKECLGQSPDNVSKEDKKFSLKGIKDASKKALGKLNTDSKLTDYIKKKIEK